MDSTHVQKLGGVRAGARTARPPLPIRFMVPTHVRELEVFASHEPAFRLRATAGRPYPWSRTSSPRSSTSHGRARLRRALISSRPGFALRATPWQAPPPLSELRRGKPRLRSPSYAVASPASAL